MKIAAVKKQLLKYAVKKGIISKKTAAKMVLKRLTKKLGL